MLNSSLIIVLNICLRFNDTVESLVRARCRKDTESGDPVQWIHPRIYLDF